jgi:hypothetical protein
MTRNRITGAPRACKAPGAEQLKMGKDWVVGRRLCTTWQHMSSALSHATALDHNNRSVRGQGCLQFAMTCQQVALTLSSAGSLNIVFYGCVCDCQAPPSLGGRLLLSLHDCFALSFQVELDVSLNRAADGLARLGWCVGLGLWRRENLLQATIPRWRAARTRSQSGHPPRHALQHLRRTTTTAAAKYLQASAFFDSAPPESSTRPGIEPPPHGWQTNAIPLR